MPTKLTPECGSAPNSQAMDLPDTEAAAPFSRFGPPAFGAAVIAATSGMLSACGGAAGDGAAGAPLAAGASGPTSSGGVTVGSNVTNTVTAAVAPIDLPGASRFLAQSTFGASKAEIARTQQMGVDAWIDEQFAMPLGTTHVQWLTSKGYDNAAFNFSSSAFDHSVWRAFLSSPDQLRQRMVFALSQILVVSIDGVNSAWKSFSVGNYLDVLGANAFGNFRTLLEQVTLTPAMGHFLNMRGNRKADGTGRLPDENYARELMQLFTIGLSQLNPDGSLRTAGGQPLDSYDQDDVTGLARILTGWDYQSGYDGTLPQYILPMQLYPVRHETGASTFLDVTVPSGTDGTAALRIALDALFTHPNVGPFISRQLIQRLITSNPSAAYIGRVAAVFANNGAGIRGDMKALIRAILTDAEARTAPTSIESGRLVEPVLRFAFWARAFGVSSPSGDWKLGNLSDPATRLGQSPGHSASVFNFYRPGYVPPNTALAAASLVAPELQITTETSVAGYLNFMQSVVGNLAGTTNSDLIVDYAALQAIANDPNALASEVELILAGNRLNAASRTLIREALGQMPAATSANLLDRVKVAILLTLATPEFMVLR